MPYFVRSVIITKNVIPAVILYDDEQISFTKSFCFLHPLGSVLSVDKTYNLGSIFVTATGQLLDAHRAIFGRGITAYTSIVTCYGRDMGRFVREKKT